MPHAFALTSQSKAGLQRGRPSNSLAQGVRPKFGYTLTDVLGFRSEIRMRASHSDIDLCCSGCGVSGRYARALPVYTSDSGGVGAKLKRTSAV